MNILKFFAFLLLMSAARFGQISAQAAQDAGLQWVFFGTYTGPSSEGIYVSTFDLTTGKLGKPELAAKTTNPTFLATDLKGQRLYAVNEVDNFQGKSGAVSAFKVDPSSGKLSLINQLPSGGSGPCHLSISRERKCVLVANYGSGSSAVLPLNADGGLQEVSTSIQHHGTSVNRERQEGPHAHFISWDPGFKLVVCCDLGLDKVLLYDLDHEQRTLTAHSPPAFELKAGSGPRHIAFSADSRFAYILNELSSTITCCTYTEQGSPFREIQTISTLPDDFKKPNTCAEIAVHRTGRFLFASNRGHDSIAVFRIDPGSGMLSFSEHFSTEGKMPRHFAIDPGGRWLLAENQGSDSVLVFEINQDDGHLKATGQKEKVGAPVCAVFVAKD